MTQVSRRSKSDISLSPVPAEAKLRPRLGQRWLDSAIGLILCAAALFLNLRHLGTPSIWFDEAFSVELAKQPLPLVWHIIFGPEPNMELYYLFLHFWLGLTSALGMLPTEAVVRFPSAIFAAVGTGVVFLIGRRFLGLVSGTAATVLYLVNYLQLVYAQQTRSYSLQVLLLCLSWYALLVALSRKESARNWWILYCIATALSVYAHLFSLLIILSQVIAVAAILLIPNAWRKSAYGQLRACCVSLVGMGVLIIPMLLESRQGAKTGWLAVPHISDVQYLLGMFTGFSKSYLLLMGLFCVVGILVTCAFYLFSALRSGATPQSSSNELVKLESPLGLFPIMLALLCWFLVPPVLSYVVSHGSLRLFSTRYLVTVVPALCLLMGLGIRAVGGLADALNLAPTTVSRFIWQPGHPQGDAPTKNATASPANACLCRGIPLRVPWLLPGLRLVSWGVQGALAVLLFLFALPAVPQYYRSAQVEDWNTVSHWIAQNYRQGDGLVCYDNDVQQGCQVSVQYYFDAYPGAAHFSSDTPGAFSWLRFAADNPDAAVDSKVLASYGATYQRMFFIVGRLPDDVAAAKAQAAQQWLDKHYHLVGAFEKRTVTVRLYETH